MGIPYIARANERTLLNVPGFHSGAFVYVYVENTSERDLSQGLYCDEPCDCCPSNFEPRMVVKARRSSLDVLTRIPHPLRLR